MKRKKEEFFLEEKDITIEVHRETLNGFASVCPRVSFERAFGNEVLLESLSLLFEVRHTHIYRPFVPFQNGLKRCVFSKSFSEIFSLVIDYMILVIDYRVIF